MALLLVDIKTWVDFLLADMKKKETYKLVTFVFLEYV